MFVLNGLPLRLMSVNAKTGAVEVNHELPSTYKGVRSIHPQFRRARVTVPGTNLVSHLRTGKVVEFDKDFNKVWSYAIPKP